MIDPRFFVGDKYGEALAIAHLAIPHVLRQNLDRAVELALKPLSMEVLFVMEDLVPERPMECDFHFAKILRKFNALNRQNAIAKASEANLLRRPR